MAKKEIHGQSGKAHSGKYKLSRQDGHAQGTFMSATEGTRQGALKRQQEKIRKGG